MIPSSFWHRARDLFGASVVMILLMSPPVHASASYEEQIVAYTRLAEGGTLPSNYKNVVESQVRNLFEDPASAKIIIEPPKGSLICGTVNASDSFGNYVGWKDFYLVFDKYGQSSGPQLLKRGYVSALVATGEPRYISILAACGFLKK